MKKEAILNFEEIAYISMETGKESRSTGTCHCLYSDGYQMQMDSSNEEMSTGTSHCVYADGSHLKLDV
jgi:hypothetical protein